MGIQQSQCCGGGFEDNEFMEEFRTFQFVCEGIENVGVEVCPADLGHQAVDSLDLFLGVDFTKTQKMLETLSCLPPLSDKQIDQQVDYILQNNRTHCLTQPDQPYIYNSPPATPSYRATEQDPPQFRYKVGKQLLSEVAACSMAFPDAFIRLMCLDSKLKKLIRVSLYTSNHNHNNNNSNSNYDSSSSEDSSDDLDFAEDDSDDSKSVRDDLEDQNQNDLNSGEDDLEDSDSNDGSQKQNQTQNLDSNSNLSHDFEVIGEIGRKIQNQTPSSVNFEYSKSNLSQDSSLSQNSKDFDSQILNSSKNYSENFGQISESVNQNSNLKLAFDFEDQSSVKHLDLNLNSNQYTNNKNNKSDSNQDSNSNLTRSSDNFSSKSHSLKHLDLNLNPNPNSNPNSNSNFNLQEEDSHDLDNLNSARNHPQIKPNFKLDLSFLNRQNRTWSNSNWSNMEKELSLSSIDLTTKRDFTSIIGSNSEMFYDDVNLVQDDYYFQDDVDTAVGDSYYYNDC